MQSRFVTLLIKTDGGYWRRDEVNQIDNGLRERDMLSLVCHDREYPGVVVIARDNIIAVLVEILNPSRFRYYVEVVDMEHNNERARMVREICYPIFGHWRLN